jgi:hypothetical protein
MIKNFQSIQLVYNVSNRYLMKNLWPIVWILFFFSAKAQPLLDDPFNPYPLPALSHETLIESFSPENPITFKLNGDTLVTQRVDFWNSAEMMWAISDSLSYEYDADGRLLNIKFRRLIDGTWTFQQRIDYSYTEAGLLHASITSSWLGMNWGYTDLNTKVIYTYNDNLQVISRTQQNWESGIWQNFSQNTWVYDVDSQMLSAETIAYWIDSVWQNSDRIRYLEYDETGNVLLEERDYWTTDGQWRPQIRVSRIYTPASLITSTNLESYEEEEWRPSIRRTYTYDSDDLLVGLLQEFWLADASEPAWQKYLRNIYQNTAEGSVLNVLNQRWDTALQVWVNSYQESFEYNENNQEYYRLYERWNSAAGIWENSRQFFSYYGDGLTQTAEVTYTEAYLLQVFPNPSSGQIYVNFSEACQGLDQVLVNIYTPDGRLAKEKRTYMLDNCTISMDLSNFLPGNYVIHLMAGPHNWAYFIILER